MYKNILETIEKVNNEHLLAEAYSRKQLDKAKQELGVPDIRPALFDVTMEAWFLRIALWGKIKIKYHDPDKFCARTVTQKKMLDIMFDDATLTMLGQWEIKKLDVNKVSFTREFINYKGKKKKQKFVVTVDLKPEIKKIIK